jgi:hypothetical protein
VMSGSMIDGSAVKVCEDEGVGKTTTSVTVVFSVVGVAWVNESAPGPQAANKISGTSSAKKSTTDGKITVRLYLLISTCLRSQASFVEKPSLLGSQL